MSELIEKLLEIQTYILADVPLNYRREIHRNINWSKRLLGIVGHRGVGKTTLILQHLKVLEEEKETFLYLSADSVLISGTSLFDLAKDFYTKHGGTLLCIDEIHRHKNWSEQLKSIYDSIPRLRVVFSGSSQISILKARGDLARRAILYPLAGLSFREYLEFEGHKPPASIALPKLLKDYKKLTQTLADQMPILKLFSKYLAHGYYPYYRENDESALYYSLIFSSVEKTIFEDVALLFNLQTENLLLFKELLAFFSSISPGEFNVHKIAKNIGKKDDTIKHYIQILHDTGLLRFLPSSLSGHALLKTSAKIFYENTNLLNAFCYMRGNRPETGLLRETFIINQLQGAGLIPIYTKTGDIRVANTDLEIGGANKTRAQLHASTKGFVVRDDMLYAQENIIPLYLFGFLK